MKITFSYTYGNRDHPVSSTADACLGHESRVRVRLEVFAETIICVSTRSSTSPFTKLSEYELNTVDHSHNERQRWSIVALSYTRGRRVTPIRSYSINTGFLFVAIYVDEQQEIPSVITCFFDSQGFTPGLGGTPEDAKKH